MQKSWLICTVFDHLHSECYRRVELLRDRREVMKNMGQVDSKPQQEQRSSGDKEEEDEDEEELFSLLSRDWRAKRVLN